MLGRAGGAKRVTVQVTQKIQVITYNTYFTFIQKDIRERK